MEQHLPNADQAFVEPAKVQSYLLVRRQENDKAGLFLRFGFRPEKWENLAEALLQHGRNNPIIGSDRTPYGVKYAVEGLLQVPDGRLLRVLTVWLVGRGESAPRFITARPIRRAP